MRPDLIHAENPGHYTGSGNNTYLIHGREPVLIDAGVGDPRHLAAVERALGSARLARILVTHAHRDHADGIVSLLDRWPEAGPMKMPWPEMDLRYPVSWAPLHDGDVVPAGDASLLVWHTPGHAPDHVCFVDERSGGVFSGDLLIQGGTVMIPASRRGDLARYLESLRALVERDPPVAWPAHGPEIARPAGLARRYLAHRREREDQILAALRAGERTVDAIVAAVYRGLPQPLAGAAAESVLAHLQKLAHEHVVRCEEGGWRIA